MVRDADDAKAMLQLGIAAMNCGNTELAILLLEKVREECSQTGEARPLPDIEQLLGICYRLVGRYSESKRSFDTALELSSNDFDRSRILRDRGMLRLSLGNVEAHQDFKDSCILLQGLLNDAVVKDKRLIEEEYFVSLGFIGRALLYSNSGKRQETLFLLKTADDALKGRAPYELNNLIWRLKAERLIRRLILLPRALRLAHQARNRKRAVQAIAITISPRLADRLIRPNH
jgi:tetratricopeptide (TPR) repeat protein